MKLKEAVRELKGLRSIPSVDEYGNEFNGCCNLVTEKWGALLASDDLPEEVAEAIITCFRYVEEKEG